MISEENRLKAIEALKKKKEVIDNREHNLKEVRRLQRMADATTNIKDYETISREIRRGQAGISVQTTEITNMSCRKIAEDIGVSKVAVLHQWNILTGKNI